MLMIALTAAALGFTTAPMRSLFSAVLVGFFVCLAYVCAALTASGATSVLELASAICCYNLSLLLCLLGIHAIERVRERARFV
jgi:hypothetical protein